MPPTDVATFAGEYPFRSLPHASVDWLLGNMDRLRLERAWVGHLSTFVRKEVAWDNAHLVRMAAQHRDRLLPVPTVDPALPLWQDDLRRARDVAAPAARVYPVHLGLDAAGPLMVECVSAAASMGLPVVLTVRFEDRRQRHPADVSPDLPASAVRTLARAGPGVRLLVTHADRPFVEEVHFGLTPSEAARVLWDISWIWGPPEDDLALLLDTVGIERFTFGTGMPLRIPDAAMAKLDLLELTDAGRSQIMSGNLERWSGSGA